VEWFGSGSKGLGRFNEPRNKERKEARFVGCWTSGDCQGGKKAVGEGEGANEESGGIMSAASASVPIPKSSPNQFSLKLR
jgi:hypothetical protein